MAKATKTKQISHAAPTIRKIKLDTPVAKAKVVKPAIKKPIITIEKIKIVDKTFFLIGFTKIESDHSTSSHPGELYEGRFIHPDTHEKFRRLRIHWAILCGYIPSIKVKDVENYDTTVLDSYVVSGISIKPEEDFQLTGYRINELKKAVNTTTPYTLFNQDEKSAYRFSDEIRDLIDDIVIDVQEYIAGKKVGEDPQGKLALPERMEEEELEEA